MFHNIVSNCVTEYNWSDQEGLSQSEPYIEQELKRQKTLNSYFIGDKRHRKTDSLLQDHALRYLRTFCLQVHGAIVPDVPHIQ